MAVECVAVDALSSPPSVIARSQRQRGNPVGIRLVSDALLLQCPVTMKAIFAHILMMVALRVSAAELKSVSFFEDTVTDIDGRIVKFLTGSTWLLEKAPLSIPLGKGVMICDGPAPKYEKEKKGDYMKALPQSGVFMYRGQVIAATLVSGVFLLNDGHLGQVVQSHGNGAVLETDDGSLWSIPGYDQYDAGYWLPPYPVIIFKSQLYLLNLKEGKKIWIEKRVK
jgi:hypothetical protein